MYWCRLTNEGRFVAFRDLHHRIDRYAVDWIGLTDSPSVACHARLSRIMGKSVMQCRSMAMQHRPEYQLSSQSPVLTAKFHPFDTHVIIGGTYSGQVSGSERGINPKPLSTGVELSRFEVFDNVVVVGGTCQLRLV